MKSTLALVVLLVYAPVIFCQAAVDSDTTKTKQHHFFKKKHKHLEQTPYSDIPYCASCEIQLGYTDQLLLDDDADGVRNVFDLEQNTISFAPVDVNGIATDSDADGVIDYLEDKMFVKINESDYLDHRRYAAYSELHNPGIYFDSNSTQLNAYAKNDIQQYIILMLRYKSLNLELLGQADTNELKQFDVKIIGDRIKNVAVAIIEGNIDEDRIYAVFTTLQLDEYQNDLRFCRLVIPKIIKI